MNLADKMIKAAKLDSKLYEEVKKDTEATKEAIFGCGNWRYLQWNQAHRGSRSRWLSERAYIRNCRVASV